MDIEFKLILSDTEKIRGLNDCAPGLLNFRYPRKDYEAGIFNENL